jgi:NitT/TauT family transport system substrate-binding protein
MKKLSRWLMAATAVVAAQAAQAESTVRVQDYPGTGNLLVRVAQAKGFCKEVGLNC